MGVLDGVRVVEAAMWGFVPSTGVILADWGAQVVKIEHPVHGDPMRGLTTGRMQPNARGGTSFMWELHNRGKQSVGIDIGKAEGRALLDTFLDDADIFITSFLPSARRRLRLEPEDIWARNPRIVYARGSGAGPEGPEAERGGYDAAAFWARSGIANNLTAADAIEAATIPSAAFGDLISGMTLAGGIAAALVGRERTGRGSIVDVSLLGTAMWAVSAEVTATSLLGVDRFYSGDRDHATNPLVLSYRTKDDRFIQLVMLEADRHWPDFCRCLGAEALIDDPRFHDARSRRKNVAACIEVIQTVIGGLTLEEATQALANSTGVWAVVKRPNEVADDAQAVANGYVQKLDTNSGDTLSVVASPVQFGTSLEPMRPAPELGADTELVLMDRGWDWSDIEELKSAGAIL